MLSDFNAKSKTWWTHDITTNEGVQIESLTSIYGLHQQPIPCQTHPHV